MAVVEKVKKRDQKYSHLAQHYKSDNIQVKKENFTLDSIDLKKLLKQKSVSRKELLRDSAILFVIVAIAFTGYFISRIV